MLADLGHALENLRAAALAVGLQSRFAQRFDEARCAAALGLDEAEEGVLAWVALRPPGAGQASQPDAARTRRAGGPRAASAPAARSAPFTTTKQWCSSPLTRSEWIVHFAALGKPG